MDDRPWPEWRQGKPMTAVQLATALRPFRIRPTTIRVGQQTPKGYLKAAFEEAWSRYLGADSPSGANKGVSDPQQQNIEVGISGVRKNGHETPNAAFRPQISQIHSTQQESCGVADANPLPAPNGRIDDEVAL
jgi:hypothetical protein